MQKKSYKKPEIKEVKLVMEDTVLTACRYPRTSTVNSRVNRACSKCRDTYTVS